MREMGDEERRAFLLEGTRTGKLAVARRDGSPYVLPVSGHLRLTRGRLTQG